MENNQSIYINTFFARQPIFNARKSVWGYELFYRGSSEATVASFNDNDVATLTVIANALMNMPKKGDDPGKKVLIHFTRESILREIPLALPPETTVVEVDETFGVDPKVVEALIKLKKENYQIVVNNFQGRKGAEALLRVANIVFIDFLGKTKQDILPLAAKASGRYVLAAKRVEELSQFQMAQELGFALFQGFFFEKPEIVPGRKLSSTQVSRLMLFKVLEKPDPEFDELAKVIQSDVSISYRLLSFINSAAFSFTRKIESIKQALVFLGWKQIKSWLWLVVLTDINPEDKSSELPYLSAIRAKFLERCAINHNVTSVKSETLYLLGLFSLLEPMLDLPMVEIAKNLPLDEKFKDALCQKKNEYSTWLDLARCFESGDWDNLDQIIETLDLDPMVVANSYSEALVWAKTFHDQLQSSQ